jgi:ribosomal protein S18 acetylase RimI-like enzyme
MVMIKVREMEKEDIPEVFRINKENFTTDAWTMEGFEREFKLPYSVRFVAEVDGKLVGYCILWADRRLRPRYDLCNRPGLLGKRYRKGVFEGGFKQA